MMFNFSIVELKERWIWVSLKSSEDEVVLDNSLLGGCDAPKVLLQLIIGLFSEENSDHYISFHGESNTYIWKFTKMQEHLNLEIYNCQVPSFALPFQGDDLKRYLNCPCDKIFSINLFLYTFAKTIYDEFKKYAYGNALERYELSRYVFPIDEFRALGRCLKCLKKDAS